MSKQIRNGKQRASLTINNDLNRTLEKLEAGINVEIGDKNINELYNEKLKDTLNLNEGVTKMTKRVKPPKEPKKKAAPTEAGLKRAAGLSKYRAQVKEALELKKAIENKHLVSYSDEEDEEEEEEEEEKPTKPAKQIVKPVVKPPPPPTPVVDLKPIYDELENMKKKNAELEERFVFKNSMFDINSMRRNMSIKF